MHRRRDKRDEGRVRDVVRIGNAQGFWGDRPAAARELLSQAPDLDFLTMDYLAEVSMSILARQRERDPRLGYARDFVDVVASLADYWAAGGRCRLIVNAGGLNPHGCAEACRTVLEKRGCRPLTIGIVSGDDCLEALRGADAPADAFANLDSNARLATVRDRLVTANAYMGAAGIVRALSAGADLVITGRVADPSLVVAACVEAFGWRSDAWGALAGATVAGHLLECGTQVTGGIATDWLGVPDPAHMGFPIAEIGPDGACVITKPERSGGMVTPETVREQLVYEIADPGRYVSPDVTVSFRELRVEPLGGDRVRVFGARGSPRPDTLKVSATYRDGWRAAGTLTIFGPNAVDKARRCGEIVLERLREAGCAYRDWIVECLGSGDSVPVDRPAAGGAAIETVLRIAVEADSESDVEAFCRELMPLVTAGPQGTTGYAEGRPRVHPVYRYWPCLIGADAILPRVDCLRTVDTLGARQEPALWPPADRREAASLRPAMPRATAKPAPAMQPAEAATLGEIAYGRSGDKGTAANVGVIARSPEHYRWLADWLTADRVARFFAPLGVESVERHELPNLGGLNFLVRGVLRRGIRNDAQGKALAQALLAMPLRETAANDDRPWVDGRTIGGVLREAARRFPDGTAAVFSAVSRRLTWAELDAEVDRVAQALLAAGFRRGDHFGVWATNVAEWVLLQFATARIGVVLVTINPSYRTNELAFAVRQAELKGLALIDRFKTTDYHASLREAVPELATAVPGRLEAAAFPHLRTVVSLRGQRLPGSHSWEEFLSQASRVGPGDLRRAESAVHCDDPINIQFTSGTTGVPKGATLSHRNVLLNAFYAGNRQRLSARDSICIPVPLYHCFGCVLGTLCAAVHGATMVFPAEGFQPEATLRAIEAERCTAVYGVPTMFIAMLEHPEYSGRDLGSLRTGMMAGSPCPIELMRRVTGEMGAAQMTIGYGQTEASPLITQTQVDDALELRVGTVGRPLPGVEARIVDPATGRPLPDGQSGELCARGHGVMLGYFNAPEMTARAVDGAGWLHTGDLALREPNGYFRITGRIKDLVIRGGENVYPREVEEVLHQHPSVVEAQVIGVPDQKFGEQVMAWVRLRDGRQATAEELREFCRKRLAHFKVPHYWKFVDSFPTTVTGKIQKYRMRELSIVELGLEAAARVETA
ncbi:MAG: acyclic terpene utilization AtuA family protein [Planctomycetia bacterium]|nr:acyclic terpene utilization AtuA family protein [Planctomycetia bacterium]